MTPSVTCRACGKEASGNFCQHCGAPLGGRFCNRCGHELAPEARFCSECGAPAPGREPGAGAPAPAARPTMREAGATRSPRRSTPGPAPVTPDFPPEAGGLFSPQTLPWWIAGGAMFVLIAVLGVQMLQNEGPSIPPGQAGAPPAGAAAGAAGGVAPDISNMTPIQAADRLFDRVMRSVEAGDSTQAQAFLPMAIAAYERARPLTHDGLFHLSMLQRTAGQYAEALRTAQEILADDPDHLLGLLAAAEAADALGDTRAEEYYRRILEVYDAEMAAPKQEYVDHRMVTAKLKTDVETILSAR